MDYGEKILRFDGVSFAYGRNKPILNEVDFSVRQGSKITLMGQNGAGKSTIFNLITGAIKPDSGAINIGVGITVAEAKQVIPRDLLHLTLREFFESCFKEKAYDIDPKINEVLKMVNLAADKDKIIKSFSGGQQARLLLASAIIQNTDILLLDEPTNNLDKEGIAHLTQLLIDFKKTCIVISHDTNFLNVFTHGVLYLDVFTRKVEQYVGNYFNLLVEIEARIERENRKNAQLAKQIQEKKDKANYFSHKGGQLRFLAKKMRQKAETMEEEKVEVRREDKTIRPFIIPSQRDISGEILNITSFSVMKNHKLARREANISLKKKERLLLVGPNGIGKTALLESLAASFLITGDLIYSKIGSLSEGQKGLVSFARIVMQKPGLLILDEPTNHINFRHLPIIAAALNKYEGAMILVSHIPEFVKQIRIDEIIDLDK